MTTTLSRIEVDGFRSIAHADLRLGRVTLLIGPNGAGKSNLLKVLRLVPQLRTQSLRLVVGRDGGADSVLHHGSRTTPELRIRIEATDDDGNDSAYRAQLGHAANDALIFLDEAVESRARGKSDFVVWSLGGGHPESVLKSVSRTLPAAHVVNDWVARMNYFHVHDTSADAPLRRHGRQEESDYLRSDGSNLASYLYALANSASEVDRAAFARITSLVQRVAPFIKSLEPTLVAPDTGERSAVKLDWIDVNDSRFGVHQFSDGTLRAIALFTALAQPFGRLPTFVVIDEPELGLHPAALGLLVSLVRGVASHTQVILATQSPTLLDHFEPEEVMVVESDHGVSKFRSLKPDDLTSWLEDYRLSELYERNVLGGRP